jgi:hypothetical protein
MKSALRSTATENGNVECRRRAGIGVVPSGYGDLIMLDSMSSPTTIKILRMLGVLTGVFLLLGSLIPTSDAPADPAAAKLLSAPIVGVGVSVCLPFSRLGRRAPFWIGLFLYSASLVSMVVVHGWITVRRWPVEGLLNSRTVVLTPIILLLAIQVPCIIRLARPHEHREH